MNEHPFTGTITTSIDISIEQAITSPSGSSSHNANYFDKDYNGGESSDETTFQPYAVNVEAPEREPSGVREVTRRVARRETTNPGAWLYARVAFLFFLSMLIIWVRFSTSLSLYFLPARLSPPIPFKQKTKPNNPV